MQFFGKKKNLSRNLDIKFKNNNEMKNGLAFQPNHKETIQFPENFLQPKQQ